MRRRDVKLGIHLSDRYLNLVALDATAQPTCLVAWERGDVPAGVVDGGRVENPAAIRTALRRFVRIHRLGVTAVHVSLTLNCVRLRSTTLEPADEDALHDRIQEDLSRLQPYGRRNTHTTYRILESTNEEDPGVRVLEAMTSRRAADQCLTWTQRAGLPVPTLAAGVLPLLNDLRQQGRFRPEGVDLLFTFDANAGTLCVLQGGTLRFCRNLDVGTGDCVTTRSSAETLREAAAPVVAYGRSLTAQPLTLWVTANASYDDLRTVVMRVRQAFRSLQVRQISSAQLIKGHGMPRHPDNKEVPILALASALAGLEVQEDALDLMPVSCLERLHARRDVSWVGRGIAAMVLLSVAVLVPVRYKTQGVQATSAEFATRVEAARVRARETDAVRRQTKEVEAERHRYLRGLDPVVVRPWPLWLSGVIQAVPDGVRLIEIETRSTGAFSLQGQALNEAAVNDYVAGLETVPLIASAVAEEVQYDPDRGGIVDYRITGRLRQQEEGRTP